MEEKKYTIGGKTYIQKPLVLGQWRQLNEVVQTVLLPEELDIKSLIVAFGSRLFTALAIIVTEEGKSPRDKNIAALADEIEFGVTPEEALEIIADFFALNPMLSLLNSIDGLINRIKERLGGIGSRNSATSAAAATLPAAAGSSGTSLPPAAETGPPAS